MILILASVADMAAAAFADDLSIATAASLLTCRSLAEQRTALRYPQFLDSVVTVDGMTVPLEDVDGVINLLPAVFPQELNFYAPEEREYQAAEIHALLAFLLSALPCRVVNRPTPACLAGPYANPLGWHQLARRLAIPTAPLTIDSDDFVNPFAPQAAQATVEVRYLEGSLICPSRTPADNHTLSLARAAAVEYLRAVYTRDDAGQLFLHTVDTIPGVWDAATRSALINLFAPERSHP